MAGRIIDSFMEWVTIYSSWIEGENRMARYPVTTSRWKPQFWRVWGWRPSYRNPVRSRKDRLPFRSCTYGGTLLYQSQGARVARKKKKKPCLNFSSSPLTFSQNLPLANRRPGDAVHRGQHSEAQQGKKSRMRRDFRGHESDTRCSEIINVSKFQWRCT